MVGAVEANVQRTAGKRPISRSAHATLEAELAGLRDRRRSAFEDADEIMRGWSDIAEKASYAASMEPLMRRIAELEWYLRTVYPSDESEQPSTRTGAEQQTIDDIIAEARANADVYRLEVWNDARLVEEIPIGDGPVDPKAVAARLRAAGRVGELRVIAGEPGSPEERCVSTEILTG